MSYFVPVSSISAICDRNCYRKWDSELFKVLERLSSFANSYTMKHYNMGAAGIAEWASESFLLDENKNPLIKCTDKARKTFTYTDEDGNTIRDEGAKTLKSKIKPSLSAKLKDCSVEHYKLLEQTIEDDETDRIFELHRDNKNIGPGFDKKLIEILELEK